jgi:hypothetical protein
MPVVKPPKKSDWNYSDEEFFYWVCVGVAALLALSQTGIYFLLAMIVVGWASPFVFLAWWAWREWYINREDKRLEHDTDDRP